MHTLASLSDEALSLIIKWSCLSVVRLWLAGNHDFNQRIVRCCTSIQTGDSLASAVLTKWPRVLQQFSALSSLDFEVKSFSESVRYTSEQFRLLPPSLTQLKLSFADANTMMIDDLSSVHFYFDDHPAGDVEGPIFWDLKSRFTGLKSLSVWDTSTSHFTVSSSRASTASFSIFPPTLTYLRWNVNILRAATFSRLPPSVGSLEMINPFVVDFYNPLYRAMVSSIPDTVTRLEGFKVREECVSALPRTLKSGNWLQMTDSQNLSKYLANALPPATESLDMKPGLHILEQELGGVRWPTALPATLTSIRLQDHLPLSSATIACLPKTLLSLFKVNIDMQQLASLMSSERLEGVYTRWPPKLSSMSLHRFTITPEQLILLPRTLTHLKASVEPETRVLGTVFQADLPPLLTRLSLSHSLEDTFTILRDHLPARLTFLELRGVSLHHSSASFLPRGIRTLRIGETTIGHGPDVEFAALLPRHVEKLKLYSINVEAFLHLPRSLTELKVEFLRGLISQDKINQLPRHLGLFEVHTASVSDGLLDFPVFTVINCLDSDIMWYP